MNKEKQVDLLVIDDLESDKSQVILAGSDGSSEAVRALVDRTKVLLTESGLAIRAEDLSVEELTELINQSKQTLRIFSELEAAEMKALELKTKDNVTKTYGHLSAKRAARSMYIDGHPIDANPYEKGSVNWGFWRKAYLKTAKELAWMHRTPSNISVVDTREIIQVD